MKNTHKWALVAGIGLILVGGLLAPSRARSEAPGDVPRETPTPAALETAHASAIADAIFAVEGRCTPGQSGEYGCYQYLPRTWVAYSTDVAGKVLPQTETNERLITVGKIREWLAAGFSDRDIFLMWNQGAPGPACYKGVNQWGVAYDSCEYARRALAILGSK